MSGINEFRRKFYRVFLVFSLSFGLRSSFTGFYRVFFNYLVSASLRVLPNEVVFDRVLLGLPSFLAAAPLPLPGFVPSFLVCWFGGWSPRVCLHFPTFCRWAGGFEPSFRRVPPAPVGVPRFRRGGQWRRRPVTSSAAGSRGFFRVSIGTELDPRECHVHR